jgi:hypothetical protein
VTSRFAGVNAGRDNGILAQQEEKESDEDSEKPHH